MNLTYSVITICLNAGETIADTVHSVLTQVPLPTQYVIVDGGSTDDTLARVEGQLRADLPSRPSLPDIVVRRQEPRPGAAGIPAAWNQALRLAAADVIFIINADDWYEPGAAQSVLHAFAEHPDAEIVTAPIQYRQAPGSPVLRQQPPRSLRWLPLLMPVPHPGCFVRRRTYERLGVFDERYAVSADYDFVYRAARAGCAFLPLSQPLVSMRPGGFARRRLSQARRETFEIARRHGAGVLLPGAAYLVRRLLKR